MKMLACFLTPDSGRPVCGHDILKDPIGVRKSIGYLAENALAYAEMRRWGSQLRLRRQISAARRALDRIVPLCSIDRCITRPSIRCPRVTARVGLARDP